MVDFLATMARASGERAALARSAEREAALRRRALESPPPLELRTAGFDLFAEIKRRAPSAGELGSGQAGFVARQAAAYAGAGAAVISVLTEPEAFGGSLADLTEARCAGAPVLRKDFLVDPYQVLEARAAGASGILLVLRILDEVRVGEMLDAAREMGLFVLLEAFDGADLARLPVAAARAARIGLRVLAGVNARDLTTLALERERFRLARPALPPDMPSVAESGLATGRDIAYAAALGYRAALVGRALMRAADPAALAAEMIRAGRREAARLCASA